MLPSFCMLRALANSAIHHSGVGKWVVIHVKSGLWRQTAEGVVRGVVYRPCQWVLLAARLECMLAASSRLLEMGDELRLPWAWVVIGPIGDFDFFLLQSYVTLIVVGKDARPIEFFNQLVIATAIIIVISLYHHYVICYGLCYGLYLTTCS